MRGHDRGHDEERRRLVWGAAAGIVLAGCAKARTPAASPKRGGEGGRAEDDVAPPEDLMREHGALNRILLVYEEAIRRIEAKTPLPIEVLASSADIIRRFIEQYHEKLEEDHLFPRFEKANRLVDLVANLRKQHQAGRTLTDTILRLATPAGLDSAADRQRLVEALRLFIRMYRPHEAREDTVLFPAFRSLVTPQELDALGDEFEDKEHQLFGKAGFEGIVEQIGKLERALGIYDLAAFTPSV